MALGNGRIKAALEAPKQAVTVALVALFVGFLALIVAVVGKGK